MAAHKANGGGNGATGSGPRYVVISSDSHDSPPYHLEKYVDYMDPEHRDDYVSWLQSDGKKVANTTRFGGPSLMKSEPAPEFISDSPDPYRRFYEDLMIGRMHVDEHWMKESF